MKQNRRDARAFTIVELLIVVGIMSVLVALALPAFQGIGRGTALRTSMADLKATVSMARQWAITHREDTFVLFPDQYLNYGSDRASVDKAYRAFSVYASSAGYLRDWSYLPPGILFDSGTGSVVNVFSDGVNTTNSLPFLSGSQSVNCIWFLPNGRLKGGSGTPVEIRLTEGFVDVNTAAGTVTRVVKTAGASTMGLQVFPLTGRVKTTEYTP